MKLKSPKGLPSTARAATGRDKKHPVQPQSNPALNNQSRRVLAQHYRAKYGVK